MEDGIPLEEWIRVVGPVGTFTPRSFHLESWQALKCSQDWQAARIHQVLGCKEPLPEEDPHGNEGIKTRPLDPMALDM